MNDKTKQDTTLHARRGKSDGIHHNGAANSPQSGGGSSQKSRTGGGALYHFSVTAVRRSAGRSVTAAIAYRCGEEITDERTGEVHDYTRKEGVEHSELVLPGGGTADRAEFWNGVELHHKRGDAVLAREVVVALPSAFDQAQRIDLATTYARELADRYGVAADVAIHAPRTITDKDLEKNPAQYHETDPDTGRRHNGNWHAHIMLSACHVAPDGTLGKKAVELDPISSKRAGKETMVQIERQRWGDLQNERLQDAGHDLQVDHRTLADQGKGYRTPTRHLGPTAAAIERRTGSSRRREDLDRDNAEGLKDKLAASIDQEAIGSEIVRVEAVLAALEREKSLGIAPAKWGEQVAIREKEGPSAKIEPPVNTGKAVEGQKKTALQTLMEKRAKTHGKDRGPGFG